MADENPTRVRFGWPFRRSDAQPRPAAPAPFEWRKQLRSRLMVCAAALALWTVAIEARLLYLQVVVHDDLVARATNQQTRTVKPAAARGAILDRHERLLAFSVDADTIVANPRLIGDAAGAARRLCSALEDCDARRRADIEANLRRPSYFAFVARQVTAEEARRIAALEIEGISSYKESRRFYPNRELAAHLLGFVGIENKGLGGLEAAYDTRIRGQEGLVFLQTDGHQRPVSARVEQAPTPGDSLQLTIDSYLQYIAERELKWGVDEFNAAGGTVIIMQPHTGEILALANYPTFNPNAYRAADADLRKNRAIQDIYEPGSTFKLVTAAAAIEEGLYSTEDLIDCSPGYIKFPGRKPIRDVHTYGALTFEDVIVKSSNVGAIKAGLKIGPERLVRYINRFGFGVPTSPDFRGESGGIVWSPARLDPSGLASVSMGYQVSVTPMQMAAAVSSVANGGTLYEPRVVRSFVRNGRREVIEPRAIRQTVSPRTAATLTQIMEGVVERGTAKQAQIEGFTIAGKTGTAAKVVNNTYSNTDYNTSFVGFLPSRNPALTIVVVIDSPRGKVTAYGGTVAAPIFKRIAEPAMRHLRIGPNLNPPPPVIVADARQPQVAPAAAHQDLEAVLAPAGLGLMPDVRGLSAREAVRSMLRIGLTPKIEGQGLVLEQFPAPGAPLVPGEGAVLKLGRRTAPPHAGRVSDVPGGTH